MFFSKGTGGVADDFGFVSPFVATFTVGTNDSATQDVSVMILNDDFVESPETFNLSITSVTSVSMANVGNQDADTVTIIIDDNDSELNWLM